MNFFCLSRYSRGECMPYAPRPCHCYHCPLPLFALPLSCTPPPYLCAHVGTRCCRPPLLLLCPSPCLYTFPFACLWGRTTPPTPAPHGDYVGLSSSSTTAPGLRKGGGGTREVGVAHLRGEGGVGGPTVPPAPLARMQRGCCPSCAQAEGEADWPRRSWGRAAHLSHPLCLRGEGGC